MNTKPNCIVCGSHSREVIKNDLPVLLCDSCGLFWRASFDLPENFYETREFDLEKTGKINARYTNSLERIETLNKYADLNNLCDVGCGEGVFLKALIDLGYSNIVGLEPSKKVHNFATQNKLKIIKGGIEDLSKSFLGENGIHTITMFHVIEHLKDPSEVLKMIRDLFSKGDKLIIETPNMDSYIFRKNNYEHEIICLEHLYYFNKSNLEKLLERSGFRIIASGNRDFNEKNMSIRESLVRLGLIKVRKELKTTNSDFNSQSTSSSVGGIFRRMIRKLLSKIVSSTGTGNYMWIVAEKINPKSSYF